MARESLANKYRPKTFDDVVEQDESVIILQNQLAKGELHHCILLTGPAGTGKTTLARILANEINKGYGSPIEIDAASHNGVDDVRKVIEEAYVKSLDSEYKTFILDEVHSLSSAAWQALLKTIEEPPQKTIFFFCTTDPQKIPQTILSRVQRYNLKKISYEGIRDRLNYVVEQESKTTKISIDSASIDYIAKIADGCMREALSQLDKCLSLDDTITLEKCVKILGGVDYKTMFNLANSIIDGKEQEIIKTVEDVYNSGADLKQFIKQFSLFLLDAHIYRVFSNFDYIKIPQFYKNDLDYLIGVDTTFMKKMLNDINKLSSDIKYEQNVKAIIEMRLILLGVE